jgi:addiction module HigA family antidote
MPKSLPPIHPGEIIKEEILEPLNLSVRQLSAALSVTPARLNDIVLGRRGITADTALRLAQFIGNSAEFWLNLQSSYELRVARNASEKQIAREVKRHTVAA